MVVSRNVGLVVAACCGLTGCALLGAPESDLPGNADERPDTSSGEILAVPSLDSGSPDEFAERGDAGFTGTLPKEHIRQVIKSKMSKIRRCYEVAGAKGLPKKSAGVRFVIGPSGAVQSTEVYGDRNEDGLPECVRRIVSSMRFHPPTGGGSVKVNYPFLICHSGAD